MLLGYYSYIDFHLGLCIFVRSKDPNVARDRSEGKANNLVRGP